MRPIIGRAAATVALLGIVLLPIYWMISTSLKSNKEITQETTFYPHAPTFANYLRLFSEKEFGAYLANSIAVTFVSVAVALSVGSLGAYAIARFRLPFGFERKVGLALLTMRIVPPVVILIPVYLLMLRTQAAQHLARADHHLHGVQHHFLRLDDGELFPGDPG